MHARERDTKFVKELIRAHILCYHTFTSLKTQQDRDKAFTLKPLPGLGLARLVGGLADCREIVLPAQMI